MSDKRPVDAVAEEVRRRRDYNRSLLLRVLWFAVVIAALFCVDQ